ncbi:MAG: hypothetical protein DCF19_01605 [Pseudanabaena frigida]|uniref:Uncharacterized protein n=1 Tax=Pseudanabaena frigida TaxID=945775 RepID=A0A2W4WH27_9CYAN|nr:MAG: hypothetical protein DCF19_01605 [Pseudanabaena frigida]
MATRKNNPSLSNESTQLRQKRTEQLEQISNIIATLEPLLRNASGYQKNQLKLLDSVSLGLYEEIDKLSKKAPAEPVTDLVLTQMNEVIRETKELIKQDTYVQRLKEFISAGDNTQHRDAVVVMRQVRQGLDRFRAELYPLIERVKFKLDDAKGIEIAIQIYLEGRLNVTKADLDDHNGNLSSHWYNDRSAFITDDSEFNFVKLDKINIADYFQISND